jgi:hypothetical protein
MLWRNGRVFGSQKSDQLLHVPEIGRNRMDRQRFFKLEVGLESVEDSGV